MKKFTVITILFSLAVSAAVAQVDRSRYNAGVEVDSHGDTTYRVNMAPIYVFRRAKDMRRYWKMIYNLKKVYPVAKEAKAYLAQLEADLMNIPDPKARKEYTKTLEKQLTAKYTPVLKKMTRSQGKILIKLIDRETSRTSYELVREFRGKFAAFFWQGVAKLFGANLKDDFDAEGDDKLLNQLILLYEAGLL